MIDGKCAELLHNEVTHVTLFYWRHKILAALKQIPTESFQGIIEMDETYFLFSEKGNRNITERKSRKRGGKAKYHHIQNVNSYPSRLKHWLDRFNGVATKYLQHNLT